MTRVLRKGAVGALLDEYERAISELIKVIEAIPDNSLTVISDPLTLDENCRSIQTILSHVVSSGYGYAISIHTQKGHHLARPEKMFHQNIKEYVEDLINLVLFTESIFGEINNNDLEQFDESLKIQSGWGQTYDIEQMMEHAIVHILRHRRQIETMDSRI